MTNPLARKQILAIGIAILILSILSCTEQQQAPVKTLAAQAAQTALAEGEKYAKTQAVALEQTAVAALETQIAGQLNPATPLPASGKIEMDYFALGDSIASGHGLMDDKSPCRQSALSYPSKVLDALWPKYTVHFTPDHFLACSGATARQPPSDVTDAAPHKAFHNQFNAMLALLRDDRPTLVSITIGANDLDWLNIGQDIALLAEPTDRSLNWADQVSAGVTTELTNDLRTLLDQHPNVIVVITQLHNPFNQQSIFFGGPLGEKGCTDIFSMTTCYETTERIVDSMNNALMEAWYNLGKPDHVRIAPIKAAFHDHASAGPCGTAPVADTWIQAPGDPRFNSLPVVPNGFLEKVAIVGGWTGDCFHPNEAGAQLYADRVVEEFLR